MLDSAPVAILTPFRRGSVRLPTTADIERLKTLSSSVFSTSVGGAKRAKTQDRTVARAFAEGTLSIKEIPRMGHIAAVGTPTAKDVWSVNLARGAAQL
jgi:hypothetical protein